VAVVLAVALVGLAGPAAFVAAVVGPWL